MSSKARNSLPLTLRDLELNTKTGFYEITRNGIFYELTFVEVHAMKEYYRQQKQNATIEQWYNSLGPMTKLKMRVTDPKKKEDYHPDPNSEFFPDLCPED